MHCHHDYILVGPKDQVHHTQLMYKTEATRESGVSKLTSQLSLRKIYVTNEESIRTHFSCHGEKNRYYT